MTSLVQQLVNLDHAIRLIERTPEANINLNWFAGTRFTQRERTVTPPWWAFWAKPKVILTTVGEVATEDNVRNCAEGVMACIGGHIACDPFFQQQGVVRSNGGAPMFKGSHSASEVALELFGHPGMFNPHMHFFDTHKEEALARLKTRRAAVLAEMEQQGIEKPTEAHGDRCAAVPA